MDMEITREHLMQDNLRQRLAIEKMFTDADEWNRTVRKPGEEKIDPDPDGTLAETWLLLQDANYVWSERFRYAMECHYKRRRPNADLDALLSGPNPYSPHNLSARQFREEYGKAVGIDLWPDELKDFE